MKLRALGGDLRCLCTVKITLVSSPASSNIVFTSGLSVAFSGFCLALPAFGLLFYVAFLI